MAPTSDFGKLLKQLRSAAGLTQADIAARLPDSGGEKVTPQAVSTWEQNKTPGFRNARALAKLLGSPDLLAAAGYEDDGDPLPSVKELLERHEAQARELAELRQRLIDLESRLPPH